MPHNIPRSVKIFGQEISHRASQFSINKQHKRLYHTLSLSIKTEDLYACIESDAVESGVVEETDKIKDAVRNKEIWLDVVVGTDEYRFWIIDLDLDHLENYTIIARTKGCFLDTPFSQDATIAEIGTAHDVFESIFAANDITYTNTTADYNFGSGSFEMDGTYAEAIARLCSVTGADFYQDGEVIRIVPAFRIEELDTPVLTLSRDAKEITSISTQDNNDGAKLVKSVIFNPNISSVSSKPKITFVQEGCRSRILFNPLLTNVSELSYYNITNIKIQETVEQETYTIEDSRIVKVNGYIKSLLSVSVGGATVSGFLFEENVVLLPIEYSGDVIVRYKTNTINRYTPVRDKDSVTYGGEIQYLNQILDFTITECDGVGDGNTDIVDDNGDVSRCLANVLDGYTKTTPVEILYSTDAIDTIIAVIDPSSDIVHNITQDGISYKRKGGDISIWDTLPVKTTSTIVYSGSATIEDNDYNGIINIPANITPRDFYIGDIPIITSGGYLVDGMKKYTVDAVYIGLTLSYLYDEDINKLTIPALSASSDVKYYELYSCGGLQLIEFPLSDDSPGNEGSGGGCSLPNTFQINIASYTGLMAHTIAGETISSDLGSLTIDSYGKVQVTVTEEGIFTINVGELDGVSSSSTIDVRVG